jgi:hypothetical protein
MSRQQAHSADVRQEYERVLAGGSRHQSMRRHCCEQGYQWPPWIWSVTDERARAGQVPPGRCAAPRGEFEPRDS